jgi:MoaA/NifB/PqqE/SkfB family radical SAM enzyme
LTTVKHLRVLQDAPSDAQRPRHSATATPARFHSGFFAEERDNVHSFRWMDTSGRLAFDPGAEERYLELWVFSAFHDLSQTLDVTAGERSHHKRLVHGWSQLSLEVPRWADHAVLKVSKPLPCDHHPADPRTLAVRLSRPHLHSNSRRHLHIREQYENSVLNLAETLEGQTELRSFPRTLGIDMYGVCNVKPPCVYCEWDHNKALEGDNVNAPFTRETLRELGEFFERPSMLVNCSIGEPFMMKDFDGLLDEFGEHGKVLELTTNGQILTDRNIQRLVGRDIHLYISLDAATAETYARLRNDRFDRILVNLRGVVAAKGGKGQLPLVYLVFMPMRVNVHEAEAFVDLCAETGVDRLVLRPLNYSDGIDLEWERNGYRFRYLDELLPFPELVHASARVAELCAERGVDLSDQMDFGGSMRELFPGSFREGDTAKPGFDQPRAPVDVAVASAPSVPAPPPAVAKEPLPPLGGDRLPACQEPWSNLYILRRGIFPCCYGAEPIAAMNDYRDAWNSPILRAIRKELAAGRFHDYCLRSSSCPIVRKAEQARRLNSTDSRYLRARRLWHRLDRMLGGLPGHLLGPLKGPIIRRLRT